MYNQPMVLANYLLPYNYCDYYCQGPSRWVNSYALLGLKNGCYMFVFVKCINCDHLICEALCYDYDPDDSNICNRKKCHGKIKECEIVNIKDIYSARVFPRSCVCLVN
ncbi:MAG: hypothetical protein MJA82_15180 [Clostridia bacterium]|nr:hypothetical protein [Clostridia bacterium]